MALVDSPAFSKLCTIVGAGPGVSMGVARAFAALGNRIALIARNEEKLNRLSNELTDGGTAAFGFSGDAGKEASLRDAFRRVHEHLGDTDVLVYNAVAFRPGTPSILGFDNLISDFAVNVAGALVAASEVLPAMQRRGEGTILLTGGGLALQPAAPVASLSIGKAGIRSLAFSLFQELKPLGIHAATVTICGQVQEGTHFSPDLIAHEFLNLHQQQRSDWQPEFIYR